MKYPTIGVDRPSWLGADYLTALEVADDKLGRDSRAFHLFFAGWTSFGCRVATIEEYATRYIALPAYGTSTTVSNYRHNQALHDYLFNACSAVDCVAFACYVLGAWKDRRNPPAFPIGEAEQLSRATRSQVAKLYGRYWAGEPLTLALRGITQDLDIDFLFQVRDVVTHRGLTLNLEIEIGRGGTRTLIPKKPKDPPPDPWAGFPEVAIDARRVAAWQAVLQSHFKDFPAAVLDFLN